MKYMGSKSRIAKHLLPIMLKECESNNINVWVEPFVGGANMIDKVPNSFKRIGYDLNPHTIEALLCIRDHVNDLPQTITKDEYDSYKGSGPDKITSLIRFGASFGGKFENGFAVGKTSDGRDRNYWAETKRNALKQSPNIQNIDFENKSYENLDCVNCLIYCDPPYKNTTEYKTSKFDHDKFFDWCREQAKRNIVFVSEYDAPSDFECVWQGEINSSLARNKKTARPTEKLFKVK